MAKRREVHFNRRREVCFVALCKSGRPGDILCSKQFGYNSTPLFYILLDLFFIYFSVYVCLIYVVF